MCCVMSSYKSRIASRMLGNWIKDYIENHTDEDCNNGKKVKVIRELARLPDGTVVKKTTDGCLTISTVFKPGALSDGFQKYGDKEPNWSCALLILQKFRIQFQCTPKEPYGEYTLVVDKFSVWHLQEGFGLKYDLINCMWLPEIRALAAKERQKMLEESQHRRDELDHLLDVMNSTQSQAEQSQVDEDSNIPEHLMEKLRQPFTSEEFMIPDSQWKILESLTEWQSDYIPSSSSQSTSTMKEQLVEMVPVHTAGKITCSSDIETGNIGLKEPSVKVEEPENSDRNNSTGQSLKPGTSAIENQHLEPGTKCNYNSVKPGTSIQLDNVKQGVKPGTSMQEDNIKQGVKPGTSIQEDNIKQGVREGTSTQYRDQQVVLPESSGQCDNSSSSLSQTQADDYAWQGNVDSVRFSDESLDGCLYIDIDEVPSYPMKYGTCKTAEKKETRDQSEEPNSGQSKDAKLKENTSNLAKRKPTSQSPILISSEESAQDKIVTSSGSSNPMAINSSNESLDFGTPLAQSTQTDCNRPALRSSRLRRRTIYHSIDTTNKTSTPKAYLEKSDKQEEEEISLSTDMSVDVAQKEQTSLDKSLDPMVSERITPLPRNNKILTLKQKLDSCRKKIGMDKSQTHVVRDRKDDGEDDTSSQLCRDREIAKGVCTSDKHDMNAHTFQGTFQEYVQHCEENPEVSGNKIESSGDSVVSPSPEADISHIHPVTRASIRRMIEKKNVKKFIISKFTSVTKPASDKSARCSMGKSGLETNKKDSVEKVDAVSSQSLNDCSVECVVSLSRDLSLDQTGNELATARLTKSGQTKSSMSESSSDKVKEKDERGRTDVVQCSRLSGADTIKSPPKDVKPHKYIGVLMQKHVNLTPNTPSDYSDLGKKCGESDLQGKNEECGIREDKVVAPGGTHGEGLEDQTQILNVKPGQTDSSHVQSFKGKCDDKNGNQSSKHVATDPVFRLPVGNEEELLDSGTQPFEVGLEGTMAFSPDFNNTVGYSLGCNEMLKTSSPQEAGKKRLCANKVIESEKEMKEKGCEMFAIEKEFEEDSSCESLSILAAVTNKSNIKRDESSKEPIQLTETSPSMKKGTDTTEKEDETSENIEESGAPIVSIQPISRRKRRRGQISGANSNKKVKTSVTLDIDNEIVKNKDVVSEKNKDNESEKDKDNESGKDKDNESGKKCSKKYDIAVNDTCDLTRIKDKIHTRSDKNSPVIDLTAAVPKHLKTNHEVNAIEVNSSPDTHESSDMEYTDDQSSKDVNKENGSHGRGRSQRGWNNVKAYEPQKIFIDGHCAGNKVHWMNYTKTPYKNSVSEPKQNTSKQRSSLQNISATNTRKGRSDKPIGDGTLVYRRSSQTGRFVRIDKSNKPSEDQKQMVDSKTSTDDASDGTLVFKRSTQTGKFVRTDKPNKPSEDQKQMIKAKPSSGDESDDPMQKEYESNDLSLLDSNDSPLALEQEFGTISDLLDTHSNETYQPQSDVAGKSNPNSIPSYTDKANSSDELSPANMYFKKLLSAVVIRTDTEEGKRLHRMKLELQRDVEKNVKLF